MPGLEHPDLPGPLTTPAPRPGGKPLVARIGDHEIHALEFGAGAEALLLLHGLSGSSRWWARNIAGLSKDRRVIVPDLIGFGRSRLVGRLPAIEQVAVLIAGFLRTVHSGPIAVAGHSMGGQIGVHLAIQAPDLVTRLILIDAAGIPRRITPRTLLRFAAEVAPLWRWGDPTFLPTIAADAWTAGPRVLLRAIHNILQDDVRPLLPALELPTLVIWGERDTLIPLGDAWEFRRRIPNSRLAVLRGAAHNPMVDRPADFNRLVLRFLDGETVGR